MKVETSPEVALLAPNLNRIFTLDELAQYDGSRPNEPIYVAIKGVVFDVSRKREVYGPGGSYHVFSGRDASKVHSVCIYMFNSNSNDDII
jgi:predicted heme/steroid binding protein